MLLLLEALLRILRSTFTVPTLLFINEKGLAKLEIALARGKHYYDKRDSLKKKDIHLFLLHQASKYIIDNLCKRMKLDIQKVPFLVEDYGNTVSSSIPILLMKYLNKYDKKNILICGFGVGLSAAASILRRKK